MNTMYYTGVGSRSTPPKTLKLMGIIASRLEELGIVLRTGDASGADEAFRNGCQNRIVFTARHILSNAFDNDTLALAMAEDIHPAWDRCRSEYVRALHARNCYQVLGQTLQSPSEFLICWTPNGASVGGTRTAIRLAEKADIPVFNLGSKSGLSELSDYIKQQPWYTERD